MRHGRERVQCRHGSYYFDKFLNPLPISIVRFPAGYDGANCESKAPCACSNGGAASGFIVDGDCACDCSAVDYEGDTCADKTACTANADGDACSNGGVVSGFIVDNDCACDCTGTDYSGNACTQCTAEGVASGACYALEVCYTANLYDSYGDGWNGNRLTVSSDLDDTVVQSLTQSYFPNIPSANTAESFPVCFESDRCGVCFTARVGGGEYPEETSWQIIDYGPPCVMCPRASERSENTESRLPPFPPIAPIARCSGAPCVPR